MAQQEHISKNEADRPRSCLWCKHYYTDPHHRCRLMPDNVHNVCLMPCEHFVFDDPFHITNSLKNKKPIVHNNIKLKAVL